MGTLPKQSKKKEQVVLLALCRDTRIRTWDPLLPKQVR